MGTAAACVVAYGLVSATLFLPATVEQWGVIVGLAGAAAWVAQVVFVVCVILFLGALILRKD
jgi:uncharacterized membrane protein YtjA (UPF0391 family)